MKHWRSDLKWFLGFRPEPWTPTPEQQAKIDKLNRDLAAKHGITTEEAIRRLSVKPKRGADGC